VSELAKPRQFRGLLKRTITGLILVSVALAALYAGKSAFWLLASLLGVAMMVEWSGLLQVERWKTLVAALLLGGSLLFIHPSIRLIDGYTIFALAGCAVAIALIGSSLRLGMGLLYIGLAIVAIVFLREQNGIELTLWTLAIVWATDIGAYFSGKAIGGPKLAPTYSPNKTWAGLIGGIASALLVSSLIVINSLLLPLWLIPLAGIFAIVAQGGDLYESWLKRRAGVKDSSGLFPGHGGALDRLDGLMPVSICMAAILVMGLLS